MMTNPADEYSPTIPEWMLADVRSSLSQPWEKILKKEADLSPQFESVFDIETALDASTASEDFVLSDFPHAEIMSDEPCLTRGSSSSMKDIISDKRKANREAAKKYRQKRQKEVNELRTRYNIIKSQNAMLHQLLTQSAKKIHHLEQKVHQLSMNRD